MYPFLSAWSSFCFCFACTLIGISAACVVVDDTKTPPLAVADAATAAFSNNRLQRCRIASRCSARIVRTPCGLSSSHHTHSCTDCRLSAQRNVVLHVSRKLSVVGWTSRRFIILCLFIFSFIYHHFSVSDKIVWSLSRIHAQANIFYQFDASVSGHSTANHLLMHSYFFPFWSINKTESMNWIKKKNKNKKQ